MRTPVAEFDLEERLWRFEGRLLSTEQFIDLLRSRPARSANALIRLRPKGALADCAYALGALREVPPSELEQHMRELAAFDAANRAARVR